MSGIVSAFNTSREKWFEKFARFGLVSKGIVYVLMGTLSVMAAFGLSSQNGDKTQAFQLIYQQPFGRVLLVAIAVGLLGYVMLRFFQSIKNTENKSKDLKGTMDRVGYAMSAFLYLSIAAYAFKLVLAGSEGSGGNSRKFVVSKVLAWDGGEWIVIAAGVVIIAMGVYQLWRGISGRFMKKVHLVAGRFEEVFKSAGTIGYICRGVVLGIIGYFMVRAAISQNPDNAQGTSAAFDFLQNHFGSLLMAIVALGLVGYGIFCFVKAKYQHIDLD